MSNPSRFSVNNTSVRRVSLDGKPFIEKTIRCNVRLPMTLHELSTCLAEYRGRLQDAGVNMPRLVDSRVERDCIVCLCEDGGPNLVELHDNPEGLVRSNRDAVANAVDILRMAVDAGVSIDPHIKNFVGQAPELQYVDFSPPLMDSYFGARLSVATGEEERSILQRNFSYFTPEFLPFHFAGDFLNVYPRMDKFFPDLHAILTEKGFISGVDLSAFTAKAKGIRALEDLRLRKQIFMI